MGKILSQDEIDALLGSAGVLQQAGGNGGLQTKTHFSYNFRRPDRISKEQIRSLNFMHDRFARNVAQSLSAFLRAVTEVSIISVEQFAYSEFLMSLPDPTAFYAISMAPAESLAALDQAAWLTLHDQYAQAEQALETALAHLPPSSRRA